MKSQSSFFHERGMGKGPFHPKEVRDEGLCRRFGNLGKV